MISINPSVLKFRIALPVGVDEEGEPLESLFTVTFAVSIEPYLECGEEDGLQTEQPTGEPQPLGDTPPPPQPWPPPS